jgi:hypothetical protein
MEGAEMSRNEKRNNSSTAGELLGTGIGMAAAVGVVTGWWAPFFWSLIIPVALAGLWPDRSD